MQRSEELGFDISERCNGFLKKYTPAGLRDITKVKEGALVILKRGGIRVEIRIIKINPDQTYTGQVLSVDPSGALKKDNITEDSELSFSYEYIFYVTTDRLIGV